VCFTNHTFLIIQLLCFLSSSEEESILIKVSRTEKSDAFQYQLKSACWFSLLQYLWATPKKISPIFCFSTWYHSRTLSSILKKHG